MSQHPSDAGRVETVVGHPRRGIVLGALPFVVVFAALVVNLELVEPEVTENRWFRRGELAVAASVVAAVVVPWQRVSRHWALLVPVLQLVAVVLVQRSGVEIAVLAVLPVLWLSGAFGRPGLVVALAGGVAAGWDVDVPSNGEVVSSGVPSTVLMSVTLASVAVVVWALSNRLALERGRVRRQQDDLAATLAETRMHRALLDRVVDTIDVAVVVAAADGTLTLRNAAHRALVPVPGEVGDPVRDIAGVGGYQADGVTPLGEEGSPMLRATRGESFRRELTWWDAAGGAPRAMRVSARPLLDDEGRLLQGVVAYQDVTDEMRALAQRDDLVAAISHELRTPITAITGYLELAVGEPGLTAELRRDIDVALRNARRLALLIDDLLIAGAVERVDVSLTLAPLDLHALVERCVEGQRPAADRAGVTITDRTAGVGAVTADEHRLTQVVDNLISNAVKYSPPGGEVRIDAERTAGSVRLEIADDGIGISATDQEHLFERFFRAPSVRRGTVPGTGLGLYITRYLVEAHGGSITARSAPGHGTTMTVELPLQR